MFLIKIDQYCVKFDVRTIISHEQKFIVPPALCIGFSGLTHTTN